jgi:hypothetical protein
MIQEMVWTYKWLRRTRISGCEVWTHKGGYGVVGYFGFLTNSKRSPNKQPPTHVRAPFQNKIFPDLTKLPVRSLLVLPWCDALGGPRLTPARIDRVCDPAGDAVAVAYPKGSRKRLLWNPTIIYPKSKLAEVGFAGGRWLPFRARHVRADRVSARNAM